MYDKYFYKTLEEDLAPYQRKGARGLNRSKNLRQVPDVHRADPTLNSKVEDLRGSSGTRIASPADINYFQTKYGIDNIQPGEVKELGTTGIRIRKCPSTGKIYIER